MESVVYNYILPASSKCLLGISSPPVATTTRRVLPSVIVSSSSSSSPVIPITVAIAIVITSSQRCNRTRRKMSGQRWSTLIVIIMGSTRMVSMISFIIMKRRRLGWSVAVIRRTRRSIRIKGHWPWHAMWSTERDMMNVGRPRWRWVGRSTRTMSGTIVRICVRGRWSTSIKLRIIWWVRMSIKMIWRMCLGRRSR